MSQTIEQLQNAVAQALTPPQTVNALIMLANHFQTFDLFEAIATLEKAQQIAIENTITPQDNLQIVIMLGKLHIDIREYEIAFDYLETAVEMAKIQQNNQLKAQSLSYSGFAHLELGNHTKAMTYYLEALNIARQEKTNAPKSTP